MPHIVTAIMVSSATSRSSVLGPANSRNMVVTAAAASRTAAMIQTVFMRDPLPHSLALLRSLLAGCSSLHGVLRRRTPMPLSLEGGDQQLLHLCHLPMELGHRPLRADVDHVHVDHPAHLVDLQHD